ncbi:MAG: DinB family protein [Bacteroidota bacterium]|nr:DinB family protein [Bacteroidota bacterium]
MNSADFKTFFEFNRWANAKTMQAVESLPEEKLFVETKSSFGTIHGTLVHLIGAEDIWLQRLNGAERGLFMKKENYSTYLSLKTKWKEVENGLQKYIDTAKEEDISRTFTFYNLKGEQVSQKIWQSLHHLVNHSTYHRGQITTLIRQLGGTPIGTDMINFYREKNKLG